MKYGELTASQAIITILAYAIIAIMLCGIYTCVRFLIASLGDRSIAWTLVSISGLVVATILYVVMLQYLLL